MKDFKKLMVVALFMSMSFGGKIAAYTYTINNQTGQDVKVRLHWLAGKLNKQDDWIKNGKMHKFKFGGLKSGVCLTSIRVSTEKAGKWGESKKAKMVFPSAPLRQDGALAHPTVLAGRAAGAAGSAVWRRSLCRNRYIDLRIRAGKITAFFR